MKNGILFLLLIHIVTFSHAQAIQPNQSPADNNREAVWATDKKNEAGDLYMWEWLRPHHRHLQEAPPLPGREPSSSSRKKRPL